MLFLLALFDADRVQGWIEVGGPLVLFALLFACGLGLPLPEDIPLIIGGFFVAKGKMHLLTVCILGWCGIIGGDCVLYHLGKKYGLNITYVPFVGKHLTEARILKAQQLFDRYGIWVVAIGRLFAGIRGAMVVAAGATRFNFVKFIIADGLAAIVSGGLFVALGYYLGRTLDDVDEIRRKIKPYEHWVIVGIALLVLLVILYILWRRGRETTIAEVAAGKVIRKAEARDEAKSQKQG
jgi:membrane protein DedA with SNARE-associated domain